MIDISANSYILKSLEDTLVRLYSLNLDEVNDLDLDHIRTIINRIVPDKRCTKVYFDNSLYKGALALPNTSDLERIARFLFNFESKEFQCEQPIDTYVLSISPEIEYHSIREVVAEILNSIDNLFYNHKFQELKIRMLDRAIIENMVSGDKIFTFKNGSSFNISCMPLVLPLIVNTIESEKVYMNKDSAIIYMTKDEIPDSVKTSYLVQCGYTSDYYNHNDKSEAENAMQFNAIFNATWDNLKAYPNNKSAILSQYKRVLNDRTSGSYEKLLANYAVNILNNSNGYIFDRTAIEENLSESVKSFFETKKKGYSYLELDELRVEIEAMSTSDPTDKMYLITRIHKDLTVAKKALEKKSNPAEREEIENYIKDLKVILQDVQNKKVKDNTDNIQIIVKYPKGDYEE